MAWLSEEERRTRTLDVTRDRAVLLNQSLLSGVALVAIAVAIAIGQVVDPTTFLYGAALLFATTAAAMLVPWQRLPYWAVAVLPIVDIVALGLLRDSAPNAGLGLLWAFPAMWIGASFGLVGVVGGTVFVAASYWFVIAVDSSQSFSTSTVLLPLVIAALSTISYLAARRAHAQRQLLEKQSRHLRRSVDRARRQEDLVTEVLDAVDFGVIRITSEGDLVVTNEAHAQLQGNAFAGLADMAAYSADGLTLLEPSEAPIARARSGETFENQLVWYGAAGSGRRALSVTARRLKEIDGSDAGAIVVSRDVTAEEQALQARDDLVASVSHELRTPLTSIIGYLDLVLDRDDLSADSRKNLEVAERNAGRLLQLVSDILAVSAMTRPGGGFTIDPAPADIAVIVRAAVEAELPKAADRHISIDTTAVSSVRASVDSHRIRQVVDNLLDNAVKYNSDGGHVTVEVAHVRDRVRIAVHDDGPGISEGERLHLFERFFRSDAVRNSTTHGSGLGLAISDDIVRGHGGEIVVVTRLGEGATFTVWLPATKEPAP
ncbi:sensor histidine kinase [Microbacterium sp. P06]|uniref:sensor histidine kinase n=1 Tax=unclassified Microbacterium TaxID=2609290 RepID=UPI0037470323